MNNGVPLISPMEIFKARAMPLLEACKNLYPEAKFSLVVRFEDKSDIPGDVIFLSEETDTDPLHKAIERAAELQNKQRGKMILT